MTNFAPSVVLYLTRNGLLEPLGQSQIFPYLRGLAKSFRITLISFEKLEDCPFLSNGRQELTPYRIHWIPLRFQSQPRPFAPLLAITQLALASLSQWRRSGKPELIHARSYVPAAVALLMHKLTGVPFIFDMRALWLEELITANYLRRSSRLHCALLWLERQCLREASGVVSLTHAAIAHLQACYPHELLNQRIVVIPTCADLERFQPAAATASSPLVIGCIGTVLSGWFLIDWLSAFFDAVARVDSTARFELISRDSPEAILNVLRPGRTWRNRLLIEAARPEQMPELVQRHTASAMFFTGGLSKLGSSPTRMAEVLGCGRPVVGNPGVGDVDEVIGQHRVGVLASGAKVEQMDACVAELLALLKDPDLASRCRRTADQMFSLEAGIEAYRNLYAQILG